MHSLSTSNKQALEHPNAWTYLRPAVSQVVQAEQRLETLKEERREIWLTFSAQI